MSWYLPPEPPRNEPDDPIELTPELRDYIVACILAARPSKSRQTALRVFGEPDAKLDDPWELPVEPVDWDEVEAEARRQGCSAADVIYDRAGRRPREQER
jgi:hypothetical protein